MKKTNSGGDSDWGGGPLAQGVRMGFTEEVTFVPRPEGHESALWRHGGNMSQAEGRTRASAKALSWE